MAQNRRKWVAFRSNATVPADVLGEDKDRKMQVGVPVLLPQLYADHVVQDGFAAFCDGPRKTAPKAAAAPGAPDKATAEAAAQARVDALKAELEAVSQDDLERPALLEELALAEAALAAMRTGA